MRTTTAMMLGAAMKGGRKQRKEREPRYRIERTSVWLFDHPLFTVWMVTLFATSVWSFPAWLQLLLLILIPASYLIPQVRRYLAERLANRRTTRSWAGTPWIPSTAQALGLIKDGSVPGLMRVDFIDGADGTRDRVIEFAMCPGVTPTMFTNAQEALISAFGAVGGRIESPHPAFVKLTLYMSVKPLEPTRNTDWADQSEESVGTDPEVRRTKPVGDAWWKSANDGEPDEDGDVA